MARPFEGEEFNCKACGKKFRRSQSEIKRGRTKFCSTACAGKNNRGKNNPAYKHGHATRLKGTSPTFISWSGMIDRCYVKNSSTYKKYGAKGISVCERWRGPSGFENFLKDMGTRPSGKHSIDRIDGNGDYTPNNCRWATSYEQANNQKSNVKITWEGKEYNVAQLMRHLGVYTKSGVYYTRLQRGWSVEKTFHTPVK